MLGVYVHIPFCKSKCFYCDFPSFAGMEHRFLDYKNALIAEIQSCSALRQEKIRTIFLGGGTPTVLPSCFIADILGELRKTNVCDSAEICVEANVGTLNDEMLDTLQKAGVNRLSLGLQACQNDLLAKIGRIHSFEHFLANYEKAVAKGFDNISIDLMFSLPGQTMNHWQESLRMVTDLQPQHISIYGLMVEENTVFGNMLRDGEFCLDDDMDRTMYWTAVEYLQSKGYEHYEISNFSKPGFRSVHNSIYWERGDYIGLGLGAHSFYEGVRFHNPYDLDSYLQNNHRENEILITERDAMEEFMFLGLRMIRGVDPSLFFQTFHQDIMDVYADEIQSMLKQQLLAYHHGNIQLTNRGIDISNYVMAQFLK